MKGVGMQSDFVPRFLERSENANKYVSLPPPLFLILYFSRLPSSQESRAIKRALIKHERKYKSEAN